MVKDIIILGTGGNSIDILDSINEINRIDTTYNVLGFLDDDLSSQGKSIQGKPILGTLSDAKRFANTFFVNGIGSEYNFYHKKTIIGKTILSTDRFETIIHPTASVSKMSTIGRGTVVFQNVTVASGVTIGNHVIILPNSVISHDNLIGDYCCIAGGSCISGACSIGHSVYIGTNASIRSNLTVGSECLVGMGAVVIRDVLDNTVVIGCPAYVLRKTRD
ncbi:MAG: acetyltransferase [Pseudodesulfovibrio sp.]|nr:acetyltransferase [Pseudodesulfovibrio sp.]